MYSTDSLKKLIQGFVSEYNKFMKVLWQNRVIRVFPMIYEYKIFTVIASATAS